jgi:DNA-binding response OmpR family regulator
MNDAKNKILIIEDDPDIAAIEKDFLEINGFEATVVSDGLKGMEAALSGGFALVLLDVMLPGKDGMAVCREIHAKIDIPVLMVTARTEDVDKVRGLGLGADDYITKPFSPTELVARVKSHLARFRRLTQKGPAQNTVDIDFGWLAINHGARRVFVRDREITLTNKEYELLYLLARNEGMVFGKEQLYDKIWGGEYVRGHENRGGAYQPPAGKSRSSKRRARAYTNRVGRGLSLYAVKGTSKIGPQFEQASRAADKTARFSPADIPRFQLAPVIQKIFIPEIFGPRGTPLDAGAAFDTDPADIPHIISINGTHRT